MKLAVHIVISLKNNVRIMEGICHGTLKMVRIGEKFVFWKLESRAVFCKGLTRNSDGTWKVVRIVESLN